MWKGKAQWSLSSCKMKDLVQIEPGQTRWHKYSPFTCSMLQLSWTKIKVNESVINCFSSISTTSKLNLPVLRFRVSKTFVYSLQQMASQPADWIKTDDNTDILFRVSRQFLCSPKCSFTSEIFISMPTDLPGRVIEYRGLSVEKNQPLIVTLDDSLNSLMIKPLMIAWIV